MASMGSQRPNAMRRLDSSLKELEGGTVRLRMAAVLAEQDHNTEKVEELSHAFLQSIETMIDIECYEEALDAIGRSYQFNAAAVPSNFESMLKKEANILKARKKQRPEDHEHYKAFQRAIWEVHHAGEAMPGTEADEMFVTSTIGTLMNMLCPLTGKAVSDLADPVRSTECRHIYDREAVMPYIRGTSKPCPIAGCPKTITQAVLKCDGALKMELKELRSKQGHTQAHQADYTEL